MALECTVFKIYIFLWKGIRLVDTRTLGPVTSVVDGTQQPDPRGRPR